MDISVQYGAQLATAASTHEEKVTVEDGTSYEDFLEVLCERHGAGFRKFVYDEAGSIQPSLLGAIDDQQISKDNAAELTDGCSLILLTPMAGG